MSLFTIDINVLTGIYFKNRTIMYRKSGVASNTHKRDGIQMVKGKKKSHKCERYIGQKWS